MMREPRLVLVIPTEASGADDHQSDQPVGAAREVEGSGIDSLSAGARFGFWLSGNQIPPLRSSLASVGMTRVRSAGRI